MARPMFYRVDEVAVARYVQPGGEVHDLVDDLATTMRRAARGYAPKRTGFLRSRIAKLSTVTEGPNKAAGGIAVNLKYAKFVEWGTSGPITAKGMVKNKRTGKMVPKKMKFRTNNGDGPYMYASAVSGQKPQLFMRRAHDHVMASFYASR